MAKLSVGLGTQGARKPGQTKWNGKVIDLFCGTVRASDPSRRGRAGRTGVGVLWRLEMGAEGGSWRAGRLESYHGRAESLEGREWEVEGISLGVGLGVRNWETEDWELQDLGLEY